MFVSQIYDEAVKILGKCDRAEVFRKLTQSVAFLMNSGWWYRTNDEIDVCTGWDGMTVTLPREIATPLAVNVDGSPCYFRGRLFQYHVNKGGMFSPVDWAWDDRGFQATQMELRQPSELVAVAELKNDAGKYLRVIGWDGHKRALRSQLEDGTLVDGLSLRAHDLTDFPAGVMIPDGLRVTSREVSIVPITDLVSQTNLMLSVGALMELSVLAGSIPDGLISGGNYFIGVVDARTVRLYVERVSAERAMNPVVISAFVDGTILQLSDERQIQAITKITSSTPHRLSTSAQATFVADVLPTPLQTDTVYYVDPLTTTDLQIYPTAVDAENKTNPLYVSSAGTNLRLRARRDLHPVTILAFTVDHNYATGDSVTANNSGGALPEPLIANVPYFVRSITTQTASLHLTAADAISGANAIALTTPGSGSNSLVKLLPASVSLGSVSNVQAPGHNLSLAAGGGAAAVALISGAVDSIAITAPGTGYAGGTKVVLTGGGGTGAKAVVSVQGGAITSIAITAGGSGYTSAPAVSFTNVGGGTGATATATIAASAIQEVQVTSGGSGYTSAPFVTFSGGGGTGAAATAVISGGAVTAINITAAGSGYTSSPTVTIGTSGSFVQFTTTGTYPNPLSQGVVYRAGAPLTPDTFTLNTTDNQPVEITSLGSGSLLLVLSRTFGISFNGQWNADLEGLQTGDSVYLATTISLPVTSPAVDESTLYYVRRIAPSVLELYASQAEAIATGSTIGRINIVALGSGDQFLVVERPASVELLETNLAVEFTGFIEAGTPAQFSTTGTLPAPLGPLTPYRVAIVDNRLQVSTDSGVVVPILNVGDGTHKVLIQRSVSPVLSRELSVPSSQLLTGNMVTVRDSGNSLPQPLTNNQALFARRIDRDLVALYISQPAAEDTDSTAGLISFTSSEGPFLLDSASAPALVSRVDHVQKEESEGFISLYAWDRGRSNDMTLIGQYHPNDINPKFRRIRIGKPCAWVRIMYQVTAPRVTSAYDYLPIENERAILMALRAMDLEDKNFLAQADSFKKIAIQYLRDEQESNQGHAMEVPQIAVITYGTGDDPIVT